MSQQNFKIYHKTHAMPGFVRGFLPRCVVEQKVWPTLHQTMPKIFLMTLTLTGSRYAMMSMKIFFINFLQSYKVNCSSKFDELETEMTMTLNFVKGYKVSIERR